MFFTWNDFFLSSNEAVCIKAVLRVRSIEVLVEQPDSSAMFGLDVWQQMWTLHNFQFVKTFMGCFGHFMAKPSVLYGSMMNLTWLLAFACCHMLGVGFYLIFVGSVLS